jgi:sugar/nucleoside kinase (ribokinase family)
MICENNKIVFLDTKKKLGSWAKSASYIKINDFEYLRSEPNLDSELSNKIIRTRGKRGCDFQGKNYPVELTEIRDTSGAGDSFLAALVVEFSRSRDIYKSIAEANLAASSVVRTRGVGII